MTAMTAKKLLLLVGLSSGILSGLSFVFGSGAYAQTEKTQASPDINKGPASGVNWTKIQDLDPNAKSLNTPIKQKWAVVIGASKFKESRLNTSESKMDVSAKAFADYLRSTSAGRFPETHVKSLINSEATRQNILANLGKGWLGSLAGPDDLVVVYISTSAFPTTDGGTYLCAYDCALDNPFSTCLSMKNLMDTLKKEVKTNRIVLILESPYSGAAELTEGAKALPGERMKPAENLLGSGYMIITSCNPDEETRGNIFSQNLIAALRADDGMLSINDAFEQAKKKTIEAVGKGRQTPQLKSEWHGNPPVIGAPGAEKVKDIPANVQTFVAAEAHYLKANNFVGAGDFDSAIAEYKAAIQTDSTYADAVGDYGAVLSIKGDWAGARDQYKAAIALAPKDALFHANYARALAKTGQIDDSDKELELAYALNPKDRVIAMALAGRCVAAGDFENALKILNAAAMLFPDSAPVQDRLSNAYAKAGKLDEALKHAKMAVKLDPKSVASKLNLGSCLFLRGDLVSAEGAYTEATVLDKNNPDAHYLLAEIREKLGDHDGAKSELTEFLEVAAANDERIARVKEKIGQL